MPDSNKSTIVIASVLKPIDDSRMYEKVGLSLAGSGKYHVHLIGVESARMDIPGITQHGFKPFGRISLRRLLAPWRILVMAMRLRPDILIITTHELIWPALFLRLVRRCGIVYDVQENYYWNILYTPAFPFLLKPFVALYVRVKESLAANYIDHFLLAEKGYEQELRFPGNRYTVIQNKLRMEGAPRQSRRFDPAKKTISLLFSGTIAETTGVFTAIDLAIRLHVVDDKIRLTIAGFCAQREVLAKIRLLIQPRPFIQLIVRDRPLPHHEIVTHIQSADFGMITYQISPATMNSIPTKLYEYLGYKLPILLVSHKPWAEISSRYAAAVVFDPANYDAANIFRAMMQNSFYTKDPDEVYWQSEEPKLLSALAHAHTRFSPRIPSN